MEILREVHYFVQIKHKDEERWGAYLAFKDSREALEKMFNLMKKGFDARVVERTIIDNILSY